MLSVPSLRAWYCPDGLRAGWISAGLTVIVVLCTPSSSVCWAWLDGLIFAYIHSLSCSAPLATGHTEESVRVDMTWLFGQDFSYSSPSLSFNDLVAAWELVLERAIEGWVGYGMGRVEGISELFPGGSSFVHGNVWAWIPLFMVLAHMIRVWISSSVGGRPGIMWNLVDSDLFLGMVGHE